MDNSPSILGDTVGAVHVDPRRSLVAVVERDTQAVTVLSGDEADPRAEILVREQGMTLAHFRLNGAGGFVEQALDQTPQGIPHRGWTVGAGKNTQASVVVCTMGKNPLLPLAVKAVLAQTHGAFEVIVVDNDPVSGDVRRLLAGLDDPRLRIVNEPRRGLSAARNRGLHAAEGSEVVAFTDDDALVNPNWLSSMLDVFASAPSGEVGAVTGPAFAAELQSPSQRFFESRGGFPHGLEPVVWSVRPISPECARLGQAGDGGPLYPLATARVGAGVSMAFSRAALQALRTFDECLGAGSPTRGGEDLDAFARVMRAGFAIVYTPDSVVHHVHRRDLAGLEQQTFGDGTGMAALLFKSLLHHPTELVTLLRRIPAILARVRPGTDRMSGSEDDVPSVLSRKEVQGFLVGIPLYLQSRGRHALSQVGSQR
ncbi:Putative glycosyltransferase EpsH [Corynebacterium atrinae]|uniref:glycosyltransferase family 2 protein n=1 Tax=Corynebacterium atrinae TaxID=1336740 RepID=UPI0025B5A44C|nr:glycosyltransferase family 2 protein [Corynebacterium atrinae]WJY62515.1 Putative glycosyltransferase EpsH [Corynebacterium atrinae]